MYDKSVFLFKGGVILKKISLIGITLFLLSVLVACSNSKISYNEQNEISNGDEKLQGDNLVTSEEEKPPVLTISVGEESIITYRGGYSWSYLDPKTGQPMGIEADSLPPSEILKVENAIDVDLNKPIKLNFEKEPIEYQIRVWDNENNVIATYKDFDDVKEKGKMIYEILATWKAGRVSYVVALNVQ